MENNLQTQELKNSQTPMSYTDALCKTLQEEFPLLGEVTRGLVDNPLALMSAQHDEEGSVVPCPLPDTMTQCLPQMMSEPLALYDDRDIRTMLLAAMMPTIGSAMSHVRVRHERRLYSLGMMNVCVGPSASGKGCVGDVASLVDDINDIICQESDQAQADYRKRHNRYTRLNRQLDRAAKGDISRLVDINNIEEEADEPKEALRRMHTLPSKTTAANYYRLIYANENNISYLHVPELAELNAANRSTFGDFMYILLAAQNEEYLHTARKTDDEDFRIAHTRLAFAATGTESSVRAFIPNLEDGLSTRFLYHNLPAKSTVRDEMDEATAEAMNDVYTHHRRGLTEIWQSLRQFETKSDEEMPRLVLSDAQREYINRYYQQLINFIALALPETDLRAPILRSRLNLYRMLMVIAILRRHEELGTAEGLFNALTFATTDDDLRWGLAYVFYLTVQTSTLYTRLRTPARPKEAAHVSALAFLQLLPSAFTTEVANKVGEDLGIKSRAVGYQLGTLSRKGYIVRVKKGVYRKTRKLCCEQKTAA